jgi:hypothetical protein
MTLPKKCIVDTNVPKIANKASEKDEIPADLENCVLVCIEAIEHVINKNSLVLDDGGEIFDEYMNNLNMKGQPGVGDKFLKWVNDNQWNSAKIGRVKINKNSNSYDEFPEHEDLKDFDISDRKFIAVANAHPKKPPVLQAVDSKWWGWKYPLAEFGIKVHFVCPKYIQAKYKEKMGR